MYDSRNCIKFASKNTNADGFSVKPFYATFVDHFYLFGPSFISKRDTVYSTRLWHY